MEFHHGSQGISGRAILLLRIALLLLAGVLGGCGATQNNGSGLSLSASVTGIKSITFNWRAVSGATYYKLLVNPDGASGYTQVGSDLTTLTTVVAIPVHLTDWVNARYLVEAYDSSGLIATSSSISITPLMLDSIGYIKASNTETLDQFGFQVSVSGDGNTMAISATGEDSNATGINGDQTNNSALNSGAVYLFVRSGQTWVQQAYIKASNTDSGDAFGSSVALSYDGNTLAVGAIGEDSVATGINGTQSDNSASNAGAVYLYIRLGTVWNQQAYIKASNTNSGDAFGDSVALSGDGNTLAVGAEGEGSNATGINGSQTDNSLSNAGAVYLFTRSSATWSQQAYIKASNTDSGDFFGTCVALDSYGNTLAVGATGESSSSTGINSITGQSDNSAPGAGAVYLFTRSAGSWSQQAYVKASNTESGDAFGTSVALSGDGTTLAVGAVGEDSASTGINGNQLNNNALNSGAAYLFSWNGIGWSQQAYIKATNTDPSDNFGVSVALSSDGNVLAVGANLEDSSAQGMGGNQSDNSATDAGAVYLYTRTTGIWSPRNYAKAPNTETLDNFGGSVSLSSDGNTLVAGAVGEDSSAIGINGDMTNNTSVSSGAAYIY